MAKTSRAFVFFIVLAIVHVSLAQNSIKDFLDAHNAVRAQVGVQPLMWNDTVAAYAKSYAKKRSVDCNLEHSGGPYGENIAEGFGTDFTAVDAVKMWVEEKQKYETNSCVDGECLHYTQIVWRNSVHLGCARVQCHNGWWFVICSYDPPGNYVGELPY